MTKRRVTLSFPEELLKDPIIYNLGQQFKIATNIHLAEISKSARWMVLELEGEEKEIEDGITWMTSKGVRVEPAGD